MLGKCMDCQTAFKAGQECWTLSKNNKKIGEYCLDCWGQHTFEKIKK